MADFVTRTLRGRLVLYFAPIGLFAIVAIGYLSYYSVRNVLEQGELQQLENLRDITAERVSDYVVEVEHNLMFMSEVARVRKFFDAVSRFQEDGVKPSEYLDSATLGDHLSAMASAATAWIGINGPEAGYEDFLAIDASDGVVLYTTKKLSDSRTNLKTGPLKDSSLAKLWATVVKTHKPAIADFSMYQPGNGPAAFLGVPVFSMTAKKFVGVLVVRINANHLNRITRSVQSAGSTVQAYIVGEDLIARTDLRFQTDSAILKKKVDTDPVRLALQGKRGHLLTRDYRGEQVLSAYRGVELNGEKVGLDASFKWYVVTETSTEEALLPAIRTGYGLILITSCIAGVVGVIAWFLSGTFTRPIKGLAGQVSKASEGDLTVELTSSNRKDEIGILEEAVRAMLESSRFQARRVNEAVRILASAASDIASTVAQLSVGTSKTSAAVTETTTTVEEVKQAAKLSSEKAKKVSDSAQQAVLVSETGRKATEDTVHRMSLIKEQMESIGETVVRLSEQSQTIEDIINAVQDIADQSNLLAVNASIEAARAGDQGKGFSIVAHEIKSLSDQSKRATDQVKSILDDTRKWVNAVVMATEQGAKAVDAGVAQSVIAGEAIQSLSNSVSVSSQAASVIHTTSEQQFVGVDQVARAMANIDVAMQQNLTGTSQLEAAAKELQELGEFLKEVVERYKI